jgi:hypothetical protein
MINSKQKGAAFERDTCRRLSLWLSQGQRDDLLWRSAMSGGAATLQYRKDKINLTQSGDVSAIGQEAYEFCSKTFVECKHVKNLSFGRGFLCGTGELITFWKIAVREARKYKKQPMLIARQNMYPTIVVTNASNDAFSEPPLIVLNHWDAHIRLFDQVTRIRRPLARRS